MIFSVPVYHTDMCTDARDVRSLPTIGSAQLYLYTIDETFLTCSSGEKDILRDEIILLVGYK